MKTIVFIRHAKSSWEYDVSDRERPLKSRGNTDAKLVSEKFKSYDFQPDMVFSSPANRALSTCKIFLNTLEISYKKLEIIEDLYDFGGQNVIHFVKSLPEHYSKVMIFGHNYAFTSLVNMLGSAYIDNLPTSGLVKIDFDVTKWSSIENGQSSLVIFPRDLK